MRVAWITLALVLLPAPAMANPEFTGSGLGSLALGMPVQQAADLGWIEPAPTGCNSGWQTARYRKSLHVGVWNDQVMVIATRSRKFSTADGIRVGDSLKRLKRKLPVKRRSTNIYDQSPIYGVPGRLLYFPVRHHRVDMLQLANGFKPNGSEFEC